MKNKVVNHLRSDLYNKILHLPIGYFTEQRKGDLISRTTNDVGEVENSIVGTLEGFIRDPLTIVINFAFLFVGVDRITSMSNICPGLLLLRNFLKSFTVNVEILSTFWITSNLIN